MNFLWWYSSTVISLKRSDLHMICIRSRWLKAIYSACATVPSTAGSTTKCYNTATGYRRVFWVTPTSLATCLAAAVPVAAPVAAGSTALDHITAFFHRLILDWVNRWVPVTWWISYHPMVPDLGNYSHLIWFYSNF